MAIKPRRIAAVAALVLLTMFAVWFVDAVKQAREAARRSVCHGNYSQLGIALHYYHQEHSSFPPAWVADESGRPAQSWRSSILPHLSEPALYSAIDFKAPWDSSANRTVLNLRPRLFGCASSADYESEFTQRAAVSGPGTVFPGTNAVRLDEITDGAANTIYAGEITFRLPWTKPEDVNVVAHPKFGDPLGFESVHEKGVPVGFCDGSYRTLSRNIDPEILRRLFQRNDGQPVDRL